MKRRAIFGKALRDFLLCVAFLLGVSFAIHAQTNGLSDAEIEGRALAQKILEQRPETSFTNTGVLQIRSDDGETNRPLKCVTLADDSDWSSIYQASGTNGASWRLTVTHSGTNASAYEMSASDAKSDSRMKLPTPIGDWQNYPFAGSDFWLGDLGMEFFHWPQQKILKKEFVSYCACMVLESSNPNPSTNGYSRVDSWIDEDSLGIVKAYAYDANGRKLKYFHPKDFKKVKGQWQVQSLVMENLQTGSRSRLEFDLEK